MACGRRVDQIGSEGADTMKQIATACAVLLLTACSGAGEIAVDKVKQVNDEYATVMREAPCSIPTGAVPRNFNPTDVYAIGMLCGWGPYLKVPEAITIPAP